MEHDLKSRVVRSIGGWIVGLLGVAVLLLWGYRLAVRGYEVDEAGAVGYALPLDYILFGVGGALIVLPVALWVRGALRRSREAG